MTATRVALVGFLLAGACACAKSSRSNSCDASSTVASSACRCTDTRFCTENCCITAIHRVMPGSHGRTTSPMSIGCASYETEWLIDVRLGVDSSIDSVVPENEYTRVLDGCGLYLVFPRRTLLGCTSQAAIEFLDESRFFCPSGGWFSSGKILRVHCERIQRDVRLRVEVEHSLRPGGLEVNASLRLDEGGGGNIE